MRSPSPDLTVAVQDYLKAIYVLESSGERVTTSALAQRMGVSAPSATARRSASTTSASPNGSLPRRCPDREGGAEARGAPSHRLLERTSSTAAA